MKRVLVMWCDPAGAPRAWATGPKEALDKVKARAKIELNRYVSKQVSCHLYSIEEYTEKVVSLEKEKLSAVDELGPPPDTQDANDYANWELDFRIAKERDLARERDLDHSAHPEDKT